MDESLKKWLWVVIALAALLLLVYMFSPKGDDYAAEATGSSEQLQSSTETFDETEQTISSLEGSAEPLDSQETQTTLADASEENSAPVPVIGTAEPLSDEINQEIQNLENEAGDALSEEIPQDNVGQE